MLWGSTWLTRFFFGVLIILALILFQTFIAGAVTIGGIKFDLSIVILIYVALSRGPVSGLIFGFLIGLLADIFTPQVLGWGALVKCLIGFSVGSFKDNLYLDSLYSKGGMIFFALILNDLLYYIFTSGLNTSLLETLIRYTLFSALYTSIVGMLIFLVLSGINWSGLGVEIKSG
jgi:rod shape-determining protein MreD